MGLIDIVQDKNKFFWKGVPFRDRYSSSMKVPSDLLSAIHAIDTRLDMKFYMPNQKWHLVRYPEELKNGEFVRVWELDDRPDLGLHKEPGVWMIEALKAGDLRGAASTRVDEIDKHNEYVDKKVEEEQELIAKDMAKEMRKPLQDLFDYGSNAETKRFH